MEAHKRMIVSDIIGIDNRQFIVPLWKGRL